MKLDKFIRELEKISKSVGDAGATDVRMADFIPVVRPIYKDGVVFITDIEEQKHDKRKIKSLKNL